MLPVQVRGSTSVPRSSSATASLAKVPRTCSSRASGPVFPLPHAAASLILDYVLNVAVSVTAGVAALTSAARSRSWSRP